VQSSAKSTASDGTQPVTKHDSTRPGWYGCWTPSTEILAGQSSPACDHVIETS